MELSEIVERETRAEFSKELEWSEAIGWSWLDIYDGLPKGSPAQYQALSALETFQAMFNVIGGWYRIAGGCLRYGMDDVLIGLFYQDRPTERAKFDATTSGLERSPSLGVVLSAFEKKGVSRAVLDRTSDWYHRVLSVHVHRRSDGTIWSSNGPIYVPDAFRAWLHEYGQTYVLMCELIDAAVPGAGALSIARKFRI